MITLPHYVSPGDESDRIFLSFLGGAFASDHDIEVTEIDQHTLYLSGLVPQPNYEDVLSEVTYENTADEPGDVTRQVLFLIKDEDGVVVTATATVQVVSTNDQAILTFAGGSRDLIYEEIVRRPISLFEGNDNITDSDGETLAWLTVRVTPGIDINDVLAADAGSTGLMVSVVTSADGEVFLNISGRAQHALYESVLTSVTYVNTFPGMELDERRLEVVAFDGERESDTYYITITIDAFDDPPICSFTQQVMFTAGTHNDCC